MLNKLLIELIYRTSSGEGGAFTLLYKQTHRQLYAIALNIVGRKELAEETVQEAFLQIWLNAAQFESGDAMALTWMISITRYRALDCLRNQNRRKEERLTERNLAELIEPCPLFKHEQLSHKITKLPAKQRDSMQLIYFSGLSHQEVSSYLDQPLGTVKSWVRRSLVELRQTMPA